MTHLHQVGKDMAYKTTNPRSLFTIEDDGLMQRLDFSDCDDMEFPSDKFPSPVKRESSPIRRNRSSVSPSDDERLDSSTDSAMGDLSFSAIKKPVQRRRLTNCHRKSLDSTPPYRKVRALRLFGSPQSPKTLLKQSELSTIDSKSRSDKNSVTPKLDTLDHNHNVSRIRRSKAFFSPNLEANINPFTQNSSIICSQVKRRRDSGICRVSFNDSYDDSFEHDVESELHKTKRIHLHDQTVSRYESEFYEVGEIGSGEFGSVFKCINRLDGCVYAIKRSRKPLKGTSDERTALNEVYAHAVLGHHKHVVRYFSAWAENDHMLIQNEYCNGGSLAQAIEEKSLRNEHFSESDVKQILLHIALGLRYIHSLNLCHMDIKPGNIFITRNENRYSNSVSSCDEDIEDDDFEGEAVVYKIGDLGHVTSAVNPEVEEGDCRYMPAELLQDDYKHLLKADIFALGLTIFEVCGGGPLPKNGDLWHAIRAGKLPYLSYYSKELNELIKQMIDPDPNRRPSSTALVYNQTLVPYACKTKEQLSNELKVEKLKNQLLARELEKAANTIRMGTPNGNKISRLVGGKVNRSNSVTNF